MYVFPAAAPCCGEAFLWQSVSESPVSHTPTCLHLSLALVFIKFTPPAPAIPNEFWPFYKHQDD